MDMSFAEKGAGPINQTNKPVVSHKHAVICRHTAPVRVLISPQLSAASYNFASAATRGLLPRSKEASTQTKLDAVFGVVQQIIEVSRHSGCVRSSVGCVFSGACPSWQAPEAVVARCRGYRVWRSLFGSCAV